MVQLHAVFDGLFLADLFDGLFLVDLAIFGSFSADKSCTDYMSTGNTQIPFISGREWIDFFAVKFVVDLLLLVSSMNLI